MPRNIKVGDLVELKKDLDGFFKGDWGKVVYIEDGDYHVAMFNDEANCPIFMRSEIKLMTYDISESLDDENDWSDIEMEEITLDELFAEMDRFADGEDS